MVNDGLYCLQESDLRTFVHDIAAAIPVCSMVPPTVWRDLNAAMRARRFDSAGTTSRFRVS